MNTVSIRVSFNRLLDDLWMLLIGEPNETITIMQTATEGKPLIINPKIHEEALKQPNNQYFLNILNNTVKMH